VSDIVSETGGGEPRDGWTFRKSKYVVKRDRKRITMEGPTEGEGKVIVRWETEGLQTVGIVCLVIMFLKLMHLLGLIDITETGETGQEEKGARRRRLDLHWFYSYPLRSRCL